MTSHEDETGHHEQDAVERIEAASVARLAEALKALDAVEGDLQRLIRERSDLEDVIPHLEVATRLTELRGVPPSDAAEALRNVLINRALQSRPNQATDPNEGQKQ